MLTIADVAAFAATISSKTVWIFVRVRASNGCTGWGEATLNLETASVMAHVERLGRHISGRSPRAALAALDAIDKRALALAEAAALSALDQAVWDIIAQEQGTSLARALGAPTRATVPLYANINRGTGDRSPAGFAARAREVARSGFDAIKIAPLDGVSADGDPETRRQLLRAGIARVEAVRDAVGTGVRLMVDCHWRLDEAAADELLAALEPCKLYWLECPLPEAPSQFAALRRLRARANATGVLLAGCETLTGIDAFSAFLAAGVYDAIMPDVKYAGGVEEILRIGEAAARHGALCSPHNPSGPIAHLHSVHVGALLGAFPFLEFQHGESQLFFTLASGALPDPQHGASTLPAGPGLGIGVDMVRLRPLLVGGRGTAQGEAAQ